MNSRVRLTVREHNHSKLRVGTDDDKRYQGAPGDCETKGYCSTWIDGARVAPGSSVGLTRCETAAPPTMSALDNTVTRIPTSRTICQIARCILYITKTLKFRDGTFHIVPRQYRGASEVRAAHGTRYRPRMRARPQSRHAILVQEMSAYLLRIARTEPDDFLERFERLETDATRILQRCFDGRLDDAIDRDFMDIQIMLDMCPVSRSNHARNRFDICSKIGIISLDPFRDAIVIRV